MRRVRIILGMIILIFSIILLLWGFLPARHEIRSQPISPTDLQLPTPVTFRFDTASPLSAPLSQVAPVS
jgi:hypothetical protein